MDLEGNIKWKTEKTPLFDKGGMILADDMIISSDGEKMLYLIDPTPEKFKVLAQAELLETKQAWAPLALSEGTTGDKRSETNEVCSAAGRLFSDQSNRSPR